MGRANWTAIDALVEEAFRGEKMLELWTWLKLCCLNPKSAAPIPPPPFLDEAEITEDDLKVLLQYDYISETASTVDRLSVRVFTLVEHDKRRRRIILCPDGTNALIIDAGFHGESALDIPTVQAQIRQMSGQYGAMLVDGTAFYSQFPATDEKPFVFTFQGKSYTPSTILTGQRQCVALAQVVLMALCMVTERKHPDVIFLPYIDNVRFMGQESNCEDAWATFRARAEVCSLLFEVQEPWATKYTFLGIEYDHEKGEVALGRKSKTRLIKWFNALGTAEHTMAEMISLFGILVWGSSVLDDKTAQYYYVYKFFRRRSHALMSDNANVWPCITQILKKWIFTLLTNRRTVTYQTETHRAQSLPIHVFSDACPDGFGIVVFIGSRVYINAGSFLQVENICVLEARAFLYAVRFVKEIAAGVLQPHIIFHIDNTTVLGAFGRKRSANYVLNLTVAQLHTCLRGWCTYQVKYVKSVHNAADAPSRAGVAYTAIFSKASRLEEKVDDRDPALPLWGVADWATSDDRDPALRHWRVADWATSGDTDPALRLGREADWATPNDPALRLGRVADWAPRLADFGIQAETQQMLRRIWSNTDKYDGSESDWS